MLLAIALFILILVKVWGDIEEPLSDGLNSALPADSSVNVSTVLSNTGGTIYLFDKMIPFSFNNKIASELVFLANFFN